MEQLKHDNGIEIKLLANRRFIYSNRKNNIVITAEHLATKITVLYPDEYEDYSKRVDFINSQGKEWTEALFAPEYKEYKGEFDKTRFSFMLPSEVTTEGELKMQFLAYLPDESVTTVPFEVIPIDIQNDILAFKKNARSNPDLLILSYNQSTEALFKAQQAKAKAGEADTQSLAAKETANAAQTTAGKALSVSDKAKQLAKSADNKAAEAGTTARAAKKKADAAIAIAKQAHKNALSVVERADSGEFKGEKGDKGDAGKDGVLFATDNLIGLYVDENGGFYAYTTESANIDFRYDEESGELYLIYR